MFVVILPVLRYNKIRKAKGMNLDVVAEQTGVSKRILWYPVELISDEDAATLMPEADDAELIIN